MQCRLVDRKACFNISMLRYLGYFFILVTWIPRILWRHSTITNLLSKKFYLVILWSVIIFEVDSTPAKHDLIDIWTYLNIKCYVMHIFLYIIVEQEYWKWWIFRLTPYMLFCFCSCILFRTYIRSHVYMVFSNALDTCRIWNRMFIFLKTIPSLNKLQRHPLNC